MGHLPRPVPRRASRIAILVVLAGSVLAAPSVAAEVPVAHQRGVEVGEAADVTLSARQLLINQRIAQAAVRRLNALTARVDQVAPPEPSAGGEPERVVLSAEQLLINQRISQAAIRRANRLAGRLEGRYLAREGTAGGGGGDGTVRLSRGQLVINQRIAQAGVRRANALAERIPDLPFPPPPAGSLMLDDVYGIVPSGQRAVMIVLRVDHRGVNGFGDGGPLAVGDRIPVTFPDNVPPAPARGIDDGSPIGVLGVVHKGVMFGIYVSIEPPFDERG